MKPLFVSLVVGLALTSTIQAQSVGFENGAVASVHPLATEAGFMRSKGAAMRWMRRLRRL